MNTTKENYIGWCKDCLKHAVKSKVEKSINFWKSKIEEAENSLNINKTISNLHK